MSISLPPRLDRVTSLLSPLRVTRESEDHGVSGLHFGIAHYAFLLHTSFSASVFVVLKPSSIMKHVLSITKHVVFTIINHVLFSNLMWVLYFYLIT